MIKHIETSPTMGYLFQTKKNEKIWIKLLEDNSVKTGFYGKIEIKLSRILLPKDVWSSKSIEEIRKVLIHELTHYYIAENLLWNNKPIECKDFEEAFCEINENHLLDIYSYSEYMSKKIVELNGKEK